MSLHFFKDNRAVISDDLVPVTCRICARTFWLVHSGIGPEHLAQPIHWAREFHKQIDGCDGELIVHDGQHGSDRAARGRPADLARVAGTGARSEGAARRALRCLREGDEVMGPVGWLVAWIVCAAILGLLWAIVWSGWSK